VVGGPAREVSCRKSVLFQNEQTGAAPPTAHTPTIAPSERMRVSGYEEVYNSPLVPREGSMPDARKILHVSLRTHKIENNTPVFLKGKEVRFLPDRLFWAIL
jgi:hypothetical protein